MSVQNPDKVVTKQDLADFYAGLLPYLGGNLPVLGEISRSDIWSTTEKIVGCSTDGKPIYQKTIVDNFGSLSNNASKVVTVATIANLDVLLDATGAGKWVDGSHVGWVPFNFINYNAPESGSIPVGSIYTTSVFYTDGTTVYLRTGGSLGGLFSNQPYIATLRYTKTTDAANSFNYASENDYSTSEKIVGTWIDGKPIYQKTFTGTLPSTISNVTVATITGLTNLISAKGYAKYSSGNVVIPTTNGKISNSKNSYTFYCYSENTSIILGCDGNDFVSIFSGKEYVLTLQYTKS